LSLREALGLAPAQVDANHIVFASGLSGTIVLANGALEISSDLTVDGDANGNVITIDAAGHSRVFDVTAGNATLDALTVTGGKAPTGGVLLLAAGATLAISHSTLTSNQATDGGAVQVTAGATLAIANSTLSDNHATNGGGAVQVAAGATLAITSSTLSG